MTLTLDEVRKTRFHMARRAGYEVTDVDNFVDKVESTIMHLAEENETLKQQLSTISKAETAPISANADAGLSKENERLRAELQEARKTATDAAANAELANERLRKELEEARKAVSAGNADVALKGEAERLRKEAEGTRLQLEQLRKENEQLRNVSTPDVAPIVDATDSGKIEKIVVSTSNDASPAVVRLVQLATAQAEQVVAEADVEATRKLEEANRQAHEITVDARTKAERVESEARVNAEKVTSDAKLHADNLNNEVAAKRAALFTSLETECDVLRGKVEELRGFETTFRANLTDHLKGQIASLEKDVFEPTTTPGILLEPAKKVEESNSSTPRLDELLGDKK